MPVPRRIATDPTRRRITSLEWIVLAAALFPCLVAIIKARAEGWLPLGDDAWFTVRSRDVLTSQHPLIGAWSSGSQTLEEAWINNLGPLQLDLLAPFTKVSPYWGTAVGTAAINAAGVVGTWSVARRLFGPLGFAATMLATILLEAALGSHGLIDPSQHLALLMPFWCLLWLCAAMSTGARWVLPWTVLVASLLLQTHFTYAYQTLALVVAGSIGWVFATRGRWRERSTARWLLGTAAVAAACWVQPLWDQFFGTGNLGSVLTQSGGGGNGPGITQGVRFIAGSVLSPPFWLPSTMDRSTPAVDGMSSAWSWVVLVAWVTVIVAVTVFAMRHRRRVLAALGCLSLVAVGSAIVAASSIPPTSRYSYEPKNYWWLWPTAAFITLTIAMGALAAWRSNAWRLHPHGPRVLTAAAAVISGCTILSPIPGWLDGGRFQIGYDVGADLLEQLDESLDDLDIEGPVLIDLDRADDQNHFEYTMLAVLQEHGIGFTYPPGDYSIARFGSERCDAGDATHRLVLSDGIETRPRDGDELLASVDVMPPREMEALRSLDERFGTYLRNGRIAVDVADDSMIRTLHWLNYIEPGRLRRVLREPGLPAARLADTLNELRQFGRVDVPSELLDDFYRWLDLERMLRDRRIAIYLGPAEPRPRDQCDSFEPGDLRIVYPALD